MEIPSIVSVSTRAPYTLTNCKAFYSDFDVLFVVVDDVIVVIVIVVAVFFLLLLLRLLLLFSLFESDSITVYVYRVLVIIVVIGQT